jgi:predicted XRE-type DNA-binding protein
MGKRGHRGPFEERFWAAVTKTSTCWNYEHVGRRGYGKILANGRHVRAHRLSWELHFGRIPKGMIVCHHCDNPSCVRPDHLFVGTHADNVADMMRKGRYIAPSTTNRVRGESHHNTILTSANVRKIKKLYAAGKISQQAIADKFGVSQSAVSRIVFGKYWVHVTA